MSNGDDACFIGDQSLDGAHFEFPCSSMGMTFKMAPFSSAIICQGTRWNDVPFGRSDLIPCVNVFTTESLCYQVNGFGRTLGEDDLMGVFGIDELLDRFAASSYAAVAWLLR